MKTRRSRLNAQSPHKPKLLAEKGGRIFARVRYSVASCSLLASQPYRTEKLGLGVGLKCKRLGRALPAEGGVIVNPLACPF